MTDTPQPSSNDVAPLLRIGLDDDVDLDETLRGTAPSPYPEKSGQYSAGARGWNPPSVEELQQVLPQYDISAFIARGGMGAVYKGSQKTLKRPVAIKVLPPDIDDGDRQFAARFKHEAQAMAKLAHPNIVTVYDAGETPDGLLYFVMEFIEGTDLAQLILSEGIIEPLHAIQITTAVCEALAFAHEEGIIHRDIKPSNIMLDKRGRVKVADFGLAKTLNVENTLVTGSNMAMGTPDFIAPETLMAGMRVDHRADIYAVGVMLYQMLTGHIPRGRFELPSGMAAKVDKGFDAIVDKAMQTDREKRYSTALEMKTAVERVGSASVALSTSVSQNTPQPAINVKKSRGPFLLGITATVIVLAGGSWLLMNNDTKPAPSSKALNSPNGSTASSAGPMASPQPVGQWVKIWHTPEQIPNVGTITDGWIKTKLGRPGIRIPVFHGRNGGIRARFRRGPENSPPPQLQLRDVGIVGYNILPAYDALIFRRNDPSASKFSNVELKKAPLVLPMPEQEFVLEFIAIGRTLIARLNDQTFHMQLAAGDHPDLRGYAGLYQTDVNAFRDVEIINLDGIQEAEALKLMGVTRGEAAEPVPAKIYQPGVWTAAWPLVRDSNVKSLQVARFQEIGGWMQPAAQSGGNLFDPRANAHNSVVRSIFRFGGDAWYLAQLVVRSTTQEPLQNYALRLSPDGSGARLVFHNESISKDARNERLLRETQLDKPIRKGDTYALELAVIGPRLIAHCNGQLIADIADHSLSEGTTGIRSGEAFRDWEIMNLDGLSEAEALKRAGIDESSESGKWRNLIPLIDPAKHAVNGTWSVQKGTLICKGSAWALCELPIDYHGGNYDLRFSVTRGEGQRLAMYFPFRKGEAAGDVFFDYFQNFADGMKRAGLEKLSDHKPGDPGSVFQLRAEWIPPGRKSTVLLQVRDEGIAVSLNESEVFRWSADWTKLHQQNGFEHVVFDKLNGRQVFGVGLFSCDAIYHSIEMRDVTGPEGRSLPPVSAPTH